MGTHRTIAALGLAFGAMACGTKQESATVDADLQKDLATVAVPDSGLALASASYERMRFVSAVEQVKPAVPSKRISPTPQPARAPKATPKARRAPAPAPTPQPEVVAEADAPAPEVAQTEAAAPEPAPVVIVQQPSPAPSSAPVGTTGEGSAGGRGNGGGGWGGILGGIIGSVVIRGGSGGVDHCDPRTDGRTTRATYPSIPISRMPVINTGRVLGGHRR